jgi:hypothetical protein
LTKYAASDPIGQEGLEQPDDQGLDQTGGEGMRTEEGIYDNEIEGVQVAPLGRWRVRGGKRPPGFPKGEAVTIQNAQRQVVVRDLVVRAGEDFDGVAEVYGGGEAEEDREDEDGEEDFVIVGKPSEALFHRKSGRMEEWRLEGW